MLVQYKSGEGRFSWSISSRNDTTVYQVGSGKTQEWSYSLSGSSERTDKHKFLLYTYSLPPLPISLPSFSFLRFSLPSISFLLPTPFLPFSLPNVSLLLYTYLLPPCLLSLRKEVWRESDVNLSGYLEEATSLLTTGRPLVTARWV